MSSTSSLNFVNKILCSKILSLEILIFLLVLLLPSQQQGLLQAPSTPITTTTSSSKSNSRIPTTTSRSQQQELPQGDQPKPSNSNFFPPQPHSNPYTHQQYASFEEIQKLTESPFENNTSINVTVPLGDNAFLRCKVRNLGERSISWYRRRDWHILTSGKITYTNDERFQVLHSDGSDDWTLLIKYVQKRDNGTYECQISTGTGIVSYLVHLHIAVPEAFILGNGEHHVEQGSNINLVCIIEKSPKPPEFIFWYHNERMINYGNTREVTIRNEPGTKTQSTLTIKDARMTDSGNYTCKTAHADPASIYVYITQASGLFSGDKTAAVQRKDGESPSTSSSSSPNTTIPISSTKLFFFMCLVIVIATFK